MRKVEWWSLPLLLRVPLVHLGREVRLQLEVEGWLRVRLQLLKAMVWRRLLPQLAVLAPHIGEVWWRLRCRAAKMLQQRGIAKQSGFLLCRSASRG